MSSKRHDFFMFWLFDIHLKIDLDLRIDLGLLNFMDNILFLT